MCVSVCERVCEWEREREREWERRVSPSGARLEHLVGQLKSTFEACQQVVSLVVMAD